MSLMARLLRLFHRGGGTMPAHRPRRDDVPAILSPGWVEVPPGTDERYAREVLAAINRPRRK